MAAQQLSAELRREWHAAPEEFRPQTRDLYVSAGDTGFWQGAVREPDDAFREGLRDTVRWYQKNRQWWEPLKETQPA